MPTFEEITAEAEAIPAEPATDSLPPDEMPLAPTAPAQGRTFEEIMDEAPALDFPRIRDREQYGTLAPGTFYEDNYGNVRIRGGKAAPEKGDFWEGDDAVSHYEDPESNAIASLFDKQARKLTDWETAKAELGKSFPQWRRSKEHEDQYKEYFDDRKGHWEKYNPFYEKGRSAGEKGNNSEAAQTFQLFGDPEEQGAFLSGLNESWRARGPIDGNETIAKLVTGSSLARKIPFVGAALTADDLFTIKDDIDTMKEIARIKAKGPDALSRWRELFPKDAERFSSVNAYKVNNFLLDAMEAQTRGATLTSGVSELVADALPFAAEFIATGGAAAGAKAFIKPIATKIARDLAVKSLGRTLTKAAGKLVEATVNATIRTAINPGRFAESVARKQLEGKTGVESLVMGFGDQLVENLSEISGAAIGRGLGSAVGKVRGVVGANSVMAKRVMDTVIDTWTGVTGKTKSAALQKLYSKAGMHGILEEIGEERLGGALRAVTGIEDFGLKGDNNTIYNRLYQSVPTMDQLTKEFLGFGAINLPRIGAGGAIALRNAAEKALTRHRIVGLLQEQDPSSRGAWERNGIDTKGVTKDQRQEIIEAGKTLLYPTAEQRQNSAAAYEHIPPGPPGVLPDITPDSPQFTALSPSMQALLLGQRAAQVEAGIAPVPAEQAAAEVEKGAVKEQAARGEEIAAETETARAKELLAHETEEAPAEVIPGQPAPAARVPTSPAPETVNELLSLKREEQIPAPTVAEFMRSNPEGVREILLDAEGRLGQPSKKVFEQIVGVPGFDADQRKGFVQKVRQLTSAAKVVLASPRGPIGRKAARDALVKAHPEISNEEANALLQEATVPLRKAPPKAPVKVTPKGRPVTSAERVGEEEVASLRRRVLYERVRKQKRRLGEVAVPIMRKLPEAQQARLRDAVRGLPFVRQFEVVKRVGVQLRYGASPAAAVLRGIELAQEARAGEAKPSEKESELIKAGQREESIRPKGVSATTTEEAIGVADKLIGEVRERLKYLDLPPDPIMERRIKGAVVRVEPADAGLIVSRALSDLSRGASIEMALSALESESARLAKQEEVLAAPTIAAPFPVAPKAVEQVPAKKMANGTPVLLKDGRAGQTFNDNGKTVDVIFSNMKRGVTVPRSEVSLLTATVAGLEPGDRGTVSGMGEQVFIYEHEKSPGVLRLRETRGDQRGMDTKADKFNLLEPRAPTPGAIAAEERAGARAEERAIRGETIAAGAEAAQERSRLADELAQRQRANAEAKAKRFGLKLPKAPPPAVAPAPAAPVSAQYAAGMAEAESRKGDPGLAGWQGMNAGLAGGAVARAARAFGLPEGPARMDAIRQLGEGLDYAKDMGEVRSRLEFRAGLARGLGKQSISQAEIDALFEPRGESVARRNLEGVASATIQGETEAQRAARLADLRPEQEQVGMFGGGIGPRTVRSGEDIIPAAVQSANPEIEGRIQGAHGVHNVRRGMLQRLLEDYAYPLARTFRAQKYLPIFMKEFASAKEFVRLLQQLGPNAADLAYRDVESMTATLEGPNQRALFERKVILENLISAVQRIEPFRFGYTSASEIQRDLDNINRLVEGSPQVKEALDRRARINKELVTNLVNAGVLGKEALENVDHYYHQQVLAYAEVGSAVSAATGRKPKGQKPGFARARIQGEELGPEYDYNTDFLEAELRWHNDAHLTLGKLKLLKNFIQRPYDIRASLVVRAEQDGGKWSDYIPETHDIWQPLPGSVFFPSFTLPEQMMEEAQRTSLEDAANRFGVDVELVKQLLGAGKKKQLLVLPNALVAQLRELEKPRPRGDVGKLWSVINGQTKQFLLMAPHRVIGWMARNLTGDLDPTLGGAPGALLYAPQAMAELYGHYRGNLSLSKNMRSAIELGVLGASMAETELPKPEDERALRIFYTKAELALREGNYEKLGKILDVYYKPVRAINEFRESVLRYAAYLHYKNQLDEGTLEHYGGARKGNVDTLKEEQGSEVAAAHLSRNLLGDYGNITVMGNWFRKGLLPFWAWQEINLKRYPQLFYNSIQAGRLMGERIGGAHGKVAGLAAGTVYGVLANARLGSLYAATALWNRLKYGDDEDKLGTFDRANAHLILGHNADGSSTLLRNLLSSGDMLEWGGINDLVALWPQWAAGQITTADLAREMSWSPANKVVQSVSPFIKAPFELASGQSYFPDIRSPRTVETGELAAGQLGLQDIYRAVKGKIEGEGIRARPHMMERWFKGGVSDPKRAALGEMYDLRKKFLAQKGQTEPMRGISAFQYMREAAGAEDYEAFKEARLAFLEKGKDFNSFALSLRNVDPIAQRLTDKDEIEFERNFLTSPQRRVLKEARDYADELSQTMWTWWKKASQEADTQEQAGRYRKQAERIISNASSVLGSPKPISLTEVEKEEGMTIGQKQILWDKKRDAAWRFLNTRGTGIETLKEVYWGRLTSTLKTPKAIQAKWAAFNESLREFQERDRLRGAKKVKAPPPEGGGIFMEEQP